jgi:hypothetical protein
MKGLSEDRLNSNIIHYCIYSNLSMLNCIPIARTDRQLTIASLIIWKH